MPEMNAIEITDRGDTPPVFSAQIVETADNLHRSLLKRFQNGAL